jgi:hypothetical protein
MFMTKRRKIWFVGWALVTVITSVFGGISFAIFPLVLLGFIELIRFFIFSVKRSKVKLATLKEAEQERIIKLKEQREQNNVLEESNNTTDISFQNVTSDRITNETFLMKLLITIVTNTPLRLLTDPFCLAVSSMDTATRVSKAFGFKTYKCRYCHHFFNSLSTVCKNSPGGKHRE